MKKQEEIERQEAAQQVIETKKAEAARKAKAMESELAKKQTDDLKAKVAEENVGRERDDHIKRLKRQHGNDANGKQMRAEVLSNKPRHEASSVTIDRSANEGDNIKKQALKEEAADKNKGVNNSERFDLVSVRISILLTNSSIAS